MVNLERKIRATQARQGGFSAVSLGTRIGYKPSPPTIAYFTANSVEIIGEHESFNIAEDIAYLETGGPFGEPCAVYTESMPPDFTPDFYTVALGEASPGTKDYTFEFWYQGANVARHGNSARLLGQEIAGHSIYTRRENGSFFIHHVIAATNIAQGARVINASTQILVWIHIAIVCFKGNNNMYVNGQLATNVEVLTNDFQEPIPFNLVDIIMSTNNRLGQMRYTQGKAIYSGDTITVPTAPFFVP